MTILSKELVRTSGPQEPVRLNKYLSDAGVCSRREADRMITDGRVRVDGKAALMGQKVLPGQTVEVDGKIVQPEDTLVLIAYHKPVGVECTTDHNVRDNIVDVIGYPTRIFPVGRLDKNSSGLIFLTNTGELSDQILRSSHYHEKEYQVIVDKPLTSEFLKAMRGGVDITLEDGSRLVRTRPCRVEATGKCRFTIILTQGMNRQIRRMCEALGYRVMKLKRVRIMSITLGNLAEGHYRHITESEIRMLRKQLEKNGESV